MFLDEVIIAIGKMQIAVVECVCDEWTNSMSLERCCTKGGKEFFYTRWY